VTRIIGVGSPFGDDRVGWRVIELLRNYKADGVQLVQLDRPGAALVLWLDGVEHVVIVDAMHSDAAIGTIRHVDPQELSACAAGASTHSHGVAEALQLARAIDALPKRLQIIAITANNPVLSEELSADVERAAQSVATHLLADCIGRCFVTARAQPSHHS